MPIEIKFYHTLAAGLTCAALLSGCAGAHQRRAARLPAWPQNWPRPFMNRAEPQPEYQPVPADPSGSPYAPNSPRGLYVPSGPAPDSKLGLPVPPPLPPGDDGPAPVPEAQGEPQPEALPLPIPPSADDMDVSYNGQRGRPPVVAPAPPPEPLPAYTPRVAELTEPFDRRRQPVSLQTPEADLDPEPVTEAEPLAPQAERTPVEAFPQPRLSTEDISRGPGHTPPLEDEEELPQSVDPSAHQRPSALPGPLPRLREPDDAELAFPGGHKQMSGVRGGRSSKVETATPRLVVNNFRLTRDARPDSSEKIVTAESIRRGQSVVVQTEVRGLGTIQRNGEAITRVTCHVEIRDSIHRVLYRSDRQTAAEVHSNQKPTRQLQHWLNIPARIQTGNLTLQFHIQDDVTRQSTLVEMPITVR